MQTRLCLTPISNFIKFKHQCVMNFIKIIMKPNYIANNLTIEDYNYQSLVLSNPIPYVY